MRKFTFGMILVSFAALSDESHPFNYVQTDAGHKVLELKASKSEARGSVMRLSDHIEIKTDKLMIHAKEADFNPTTGELETHGTVHIQLLRSKGPCPAL